MLLAMAMTGGPAAADPAVGAEPSTTLKEADLPGGEFSADYRAPTRIPAGVGRVSGTGGVGSDDYLLFDLSPGAQVVTLEFRAPEGIGYSYSAGGVVLFDTRAFAYEWAGTQAPEPIRLDHRRRQQSMTIALPESFGGRLFIALNYTHGEDIAWSLSVPANVPVLTTVEAPGRALPAPRALPLRAPGPLLRSRRRAGAAAPGRA
jgi:hypothetical protein